MESFPGAEELGSFPNLIQPQPIRPMIDIDGEKPRPAPKSEAHLSGSQGDHVLPSGSNSNGNK